MSKAPTALKRIVLGRPMSSGELEHTLLPKRLALPVFASDALSSMAYATQEILIVLALAGTAALSLVFPISIAVSMLLAIVITSYRQIVRAYPGGGGAYVVARENLGFTAGLAVGAALLLDYILTVSVSITAGGDAIVSAFPTLATHKLGITITLILIVTLANLRGSKESGRIFAVPTYGFVLAMYALILTGFVKCIGGCPQAASADHGLTAASGVTFFLLLKAFSAGTTALTGVEAIAEGVPVFRFPQSRNAATTLTVLGFLSISMFVGMSWLTDRTNVVFEHGSELTSVAQVAEAVYGRGLMFYITQVVTALILILAANTAYTGFPVLASILAQDRMMPRQFRSRGDRLVFSNGIVILAIFAALLVYAFDANLNQLIQLYLVGVFLSFTLAQFGTVVRWRRTREPQWQRSATINAVGGTVTGVVLLVVVWTKFATGAWIIILATPIVMLVMRSIYLHYTEVAEQLADEERRPVDRRPGHQHMVILVSTIDASVTRALGYARSVRPSTLTVMTTDRAVHAACRRLAADMNVEILEGRGALRPRLKQYLASRRAELSEDDFLSVMIPEVLESATLVEIFRRPGIHRLKGWLLNEPGIQVMDIPLVKHEIDPHADQAHEPGRNYVIVLVSGVHNATLQAIEYAETLRPIDIRAVSFGLDPAETEKLGNAWLDAAIPHPLEIDDSPFRDLGRSLLSYVRQFEADGLHVVVTVVLPEFVTKRHHHRVLHGQTALIIKRHLLFEPGVVTVSVPYHLER
ncbi:MAG: APC family permease [Actinomycetota bacterium]|nr:APC family permease [Actinomycetota bacterium]